MLRQQHKIKKGLDTLVKKNKSTLKPFKNILVGIPKNLIRISIALILISFVYIGYILTNEQFELDFLQASEQDFDSKTSVHPFFVYLQQYYDPSARFKNQYKAQNAYNANEMFQIPQTKLEVLSTKKFYRYFLTQNAPLHIVDGCMQWPAHQTWSLDRLKQIFGATSLEVKQIFSYDRDPVAQQNGLSDRFMFDIEKTKVITQQMTIDHYFETVERMRKDIYVDHVQNPDQQNKATAREVKHMVYID